MTDPESTSGIQRFKEAIRQFDEANAQDPRSESVAGKPQPRELLFARRVYAWIEKLVAKPSEDLLLAARAHTLRRWAIARDRYPKTTQGYHQWRSALADFHADEAERILRNVGYAGDAIQRVRTLITKAHWPQNADAQALEDADCLVFLETKLHEYVDEWEPEKMDRILAQTVRKMTPNARRQVATLSLGSREKNLVERATRTS